MLSDTQCGPVADSPQHSGSSTRDGETHPPLLDVAHVARVVGLTTHTVRGYAARGRISPIRIGGRIFFRPETINPWIAERRRLRTRDPQQGPTLPVGIDPHDRLTHREREVLGLILHGATRRQLLAQLAVAAGTLDSHRKSIRLKLGVRQIADLVARFASVER